MAAARSRIVRFARFGSACMVVCIGYRWFHCEALCVSGGATGPSNYLDVAPQPAYGLFEAVCDADVLAAADNGGRDHVFGEERIRPCESGGIIGSEQNVSLPAKSWDRVWSQRSMISISPRLV
jgi:hypothetical protein